MDPVSDVGEIYGAVERMAALSDEIPFDWPRRIVFANKKQEGDYVFCYGFMGQNSTLFRDKPVKRRVAIKRLQALLEILPWEYVDICYPQEKEE